MLSSDQFFDEFTRLSGLLEQGLDALKRHVAGYAQAEAEYRKAKAQAWINAPRFHEDTKVTAGEREAWVTGETAALRHTRDIADGMRQAALEAVRSRRAQISALQTLLNAHQEEAKFARTGPA
jgi:hypothetical protein